MNKKTILVLTYTGALSCPCIKYFHMNITGQRLDLKVKSVHLHFLHPSSPVAK